ncbi:activator of Hsp90 ATPase [Cystobasidium minutum MCA 4210]|uniref:activator of Hsp90 ATPase n=1 Tax=Cystobasidium minutum MCA 4210 TaxID=1397322 RepID=UPI0034CD1962|eukprot:jgi/Rhomi1/171990/fgenesh1_kg.4_\
MSGLSSGLKNWHWRSKNTQPWAVQWFKKNLGGLSTPKTRVVDVRDIDGDCDLGMRKSKLVTIYDLKITSIWEGTLSDGTVVRGLLTAIEVSHDMDESEYQFENTFEDPATYSSNAEAQALKQEASKQLADLMRSKFQEMPKAMIAEHGKDLLAEAENDSNAASANASGASTPATGGAAKATATASASSASSASKGPTGKRVSTARITRQEDFMISAADLFDLLTNDAKVPSWSRNKATIKPEEGADASLFGGNITGKILSVSPPDFFSQTWRAPTWPEGHYGTLKVSLEQGSGSTKLSLELEGVPVGKEEETEKGLEIYYIRSLKQIGLGTIL